MVLGLALFLSLSACATEPADDGDGGDESAEDTDGGSVAPDEMEPRALLLEIEEADPEQLTFGDGGDPGSGAGAGSPTTGAEASADADAEGGLPGDAVGGPVPDPVTREMPERPDAVVHEPLDPSSLSYGELTAGIWDDNRSFDFFRLYQAEMHDLHPEGLMDFSLEEHYLPVREGYPAAQTAHETLDISVVLDTTGSMGDEITYLQGEFLNISETIRARYPDAEQRWSLVVYRDVGHEEYLFRTMEFSSDLEEFHDALLRQRANGGGDFPEAPDVGLAEAGQLDWRENESTARMIFWVADAPHHTEHAQAMKDAVEAARNKDIHIYPVGASGLDEFTEFSMRQAAQLTMGRYVFLTDDSGLGGAHKEPTLPCYYVTSLSDAILRGVDAEMTGNYATPTDDQIVRQGGTFSGEGYCSYGERSETLVY